MRPGSYSTGPRPSPCPYSPECVERLSEKGKRSLPCSLTEHQNGTFRPIFASQHVQIRAQSVVRTPFRTVSPRTPVNMANKTGSGDVPLLATHRVLRQRLAILGPIAREGVAQRWSTQRNSGILRSVSTRPQQPATFPSSTGISHAKRERSSSAPPLTNGGRVLRPSVKRRELSRRPP